MSRPSLLEPPGKGRETPILLPPPPLPTGPLQRRGWWRRKCLETQGALPGAVPLDDQTPLVGPTPLARCLVLGGRDGGSPAPLFQEVGVVGVEVWVGMGVGVGGECPPPCCTTAWGHMSSATQKCSVGEMAYKACGPKFTRGPPLGANSCVP